MWGLRLLLFATVYGLAQIGVPCGGLLQLALVMFVSVSTASAWWMTGKKRRKDQTSLWWFIQHCQTALFFVMVLYHRPAGSRIDGYYCWILPPKVNRQWWDEHCAPSADTCDGSNLQIRWFVLSLAANVWLLLLGFFRCCLYFETKLGL
jgi:hypothetical protein